MVSFKPCKNIVIARVTSVSGTQVPLDSTVNPYLLMHNCVEGVRAMPLTRLLLSYQEMTSFSVYQVELNDKPQGFETMKK